MLSFPMLAEDGHATRSERENCDGLRRPVEQVGDLAGLAPAEHQDVPTRPEQLRGGGRPGGSDRHRRRWWTTCLPSWRRWSGADPVRDLPELMIRKPT